MSPSGGPYLCPREVRALWIPHGITQSRPMRRAPSSQNQSFTKSKELAHLCLTDMSRDHGGEPVWDRTLCSPDPLPRAASLPGTCPLCWHHLRSSLTQHSQAVHYKSAANESGQPVRHSANIPLLTQQLSVVPEAGSLSGSMMPGLGEGVPLHHPQASVWDVKPHSVHVFRDIIWMATEERRNSLAQARV